MSNIRCIKTGETLPICPHCERRLTAVLGQPCSECKAFEGIMEVVAEQICSPRQHTCPSCKRVPVSDERIWCSECHEVFVAGPRRELERDRARKYVVELNQRVGARGPGGELP